MVEDDLLDAVIALPGELFYTTSIPVCLWIISKGKDSDSYRNRTDETLFINAKDLYESIDRTQNRLTEEHIQNIANTVRAYRGEDTVDDYEDETGLCRVATTDEIANNDYMVTPGRYVGVNRDTGNKVPYEVKMEELSAELREQFQQSNKLQEDIEANLEELGF
jgi:type I restriction enzyme M protein